MFVVLRFNLWPAIYPPRGCEASREIEMMRRVCLPRYKFEIISRRAVNYNSKSGV
jgi:hypothetical protein